MSALQLHTWIVRILLLQCEKGVRVQLVEPAFVMTSSVYAVYHIVVILYEKAIS